MQPAADGHFQVPLGWGQGRAVFGGLLVGALINAAQRLFDEPGWSLRTLSSTLVAVPEAGPAQVSTAVMRLGAGSVVIEARLMQHAQVTVQAVMVFGKARSSELDFVGAPAPF